MLRYTGEIVHTEALLPEAPPAAVWEEIRARRNESAILLAGHQPHMSSLAAFLLDSPALAGGHEKSGADAHRLRAGRFCGLAEC